MNKFGVNCHGCITFRVKCSELSRVNISFEETIFGELIYTYSGYKFVSCPPLHEISNVDKHSSRNRPGRGVCPIHWKHLQRENNVLHLIA